MPRAMLVSLLALLAPAALAQEPGSPGRGQVYAERTCAECHAIKPAAALSPNPGAAPFQVIADTPGMTARALSVWLRTTHKTMPNLIIGDDDRDDVIAYITSLRRAQSGK